MIDNRKFEGQYNKITEDGVIELYSGGTRSFNEISRLIDIDPITIKNILLRRNVKLHNKSKFYRIHSLNEDYFEKIDSEDKAYFLGLIYADGCVFRNCLKISLQEEDGYILGVLKDKLNYGGAISKVNPKIETSHKPQSSLQIGSKKLVSDLNKLGCIARKSLVLEFPTNKQVPRHLIFHFIRGCFDGDGWVFEEKRIITNATLVARQDLLAQCLL